jgi:hypothetical protein
MITSSGAICDVCGKYILPIDPNELVNCFSMKGIKETLHCDNKCKQLLLNINNDWTKLPKEGRLYKAFEEYNKEK